MGNKIILLIIFIILVLVFLVHRKREFFYQSRCETCDDLEIKSAVGKFDCCNNFNIVSNLDYDLDDIYGPKCLNTCLVEHVAKINFEEALQQEKVEKDILKYSRENQSNGFCHSFNKKTNGINKCVEDCTEQCTNEESCEIKNDVCVEKSVNFLSGGSMLNSTKCSFHNYNNNTKGCVNKYIANIETLKKIYDEEVEKNNLLKCKA